MIFPSAFPHSIGQTPSRPSSLPLQHQFSTLAALRSPDFFSDQVAAFLFDSHWLWWLAIAAVAVVFFFLGRSRADKRLLQAGIVAFAVTALWILVALLVASPGERLYNAHKGLAQAAAAHDVDRMLTYLSDNFLAPVIGITADVPARATIAGYLDRYGIKQTHITAYRYTRGTTTAVSDVTFITESSAGPIKTAWRLSWDDIAGQDWQIVRAELLRLQDQPVARDLVIP